MASHGDATADEGGTLPGTLGEPAIQTDASMGPFLLNQRQAAALLGISPRTLARRSADGTIPSFLIGRRRLYSRFRLAQWAAEQAAKRSTTMGQRRLT